MKLRVPFYYDEFKCIADKCKDNCCRGGWEIDIDEDTYNYYQQLEGEVGDKIRKSITKTDEYCFKLVDGHCPFLNDEGLCGLYKEVGEKYLGVVCAQFPRFSEYYGVIKETGIGLACEEAERIIFSHRENFSMIEKSCDEEYIEDDEFDNALANELFRVREQLFKLLANDEYSIYEKLIIILNEADEIQNCINEGNYKGISRIASEYELDKDEKCLAEADYNMEEGNYDNISVKDDIRSIIGAYEDMEILDERWQKMLDRVIETFHGEEYSDEEYFALDTEFVNYIRQREYEYKSFVEYLVFRYFMKAVYDHDVLGKAQMIVSNFLILRELDMLRWLDNGKEYTFEDRIDVVHIFSRQVEYSEDNIEILYEDFIFDDVFKKDNLIGLLWIDSTSE